jgi:hypothetical protein
MNTLSSKRTGLAALTDACDRERHGSSKRTVPVAASKPTSPARSKQRTNRLSPWENSVGDA